MTKQEAIDNIEFEHCGYCRARENECKECEFGIAIECIEKQIPKKPTIEYLPLFKAYCPVCEGRLLPSKWCAKCGQAIDWSDNE